MAPTVRYLTHPQVLIDPAKEITDWSLNSVGTARVTALARQLGSLSATKRVISSPERKALETARPLATALGVSLEIRPLMHENDRSSTGFLPPEEFEKVADAFFANPSQSIRGWETAHDAQRRIMSEVELCLSYVVKGDVLFVGHGGVGTLLFCALTGATIDRRHDQGPGGGGCWFQFDSTDRRPPRPWQVMESLAQGG